MARRRIGISTYTRHVATFVKRSLLCGRKGLLVVSVLLILVNFNLVLRVWRRNVTSVMNNSVNVTNVTGRQFQDKRYSEVLDKLESLIDNDTLYPESLDVEPVLEALRNVKILHIGKMRVASSMKWMMTLEGGHKAIFKPQTVPKSRRSGHCFKFHCEHPEYEIAAFHMNRLLGLRNMPYVTGRVLSWWNEVLPLATEELLHRYTNISADGRTIRSKTVCNMEGDSVRYEFKDGRVPGAIIYYLKDKAHFIADTGSQFFDYKIARIIHGRDRNASLRYLNLLPGDDSYCKIFREKKWYNEERWFADATDIAVMDFLLMHLDSPHNYINRSNGELMNVMVDFGRAFCLYPQSLRIIAPVTQCCKVRKRVFDSLVKYRDNLPEVLESMTTTDPFHPVLEPDLKEVIRSRQKQLLSLIDYCIALSNISNVMMDI